MEKEITISKRFLIEKASGRTVRFERIDLINHSEEINKFYLKACVQSDCYIIALSLHDNQVRKNSCKIAPKIMMLQNSINPLKVDVNKDLYVELIPQEGYILKQQNGIAILKYSFV